MNRSRTKINSGQTLVELLIAMAVFSLIIGPFLSSLINLTAAQVRYRHRIQAAQYAREELEIAYNIAVNAEAWEDFTNLVDPDNPEKPYHPSPTGVLAFDEGTELIGGIFTRETTFKKARRDDAGNVVDDETATEDENTIKVVAKVSWRERGKDQEIVLTTYLMNFEFLGG